MTTIAADARSGVMVSDSKCSGASSWVPATKVFRIDGELLGFAGNIADREKWLKWHRSGRKGVRPKLEDFVALRLIAGLLYEVSGDGLELLIERGFHAIGSGGPAALGAMLAGKDARDSVQIACQIDNNSGGDICVFELKEKAQ